MTAYSARRKPEDGFYEFAASVVDAVANSIVGNLDPEARSNLVDAFAAVQRHRNMPRAPTVSGGVASLLI